MHAVLMTPAFEKKVRAVGMSDDEVLEICVFLSENPRAGVLMPGTAGARKLRFAGRGKGKSGGYRTVHFFGGEDVPLFLLGLIDKGDAANLTKAERNALAATLPQLAEAYRAGVAAKKTWRK